jgi:hypothetical protein
MVLAFTGAFTSPAGMVSWIKLFPGRKIKNLSERAVKACRRSCKNFNKWGILRQEKSSEDFDDAQNFTTDQMSIKRTQSRYLKPLEG